MSSMPRCAFPAEIVVVSNERDAADAIEDLTNDYWLNPKGGVGFDLEWKPQRKRGEKSPIALIQLATENFAVIFQLQHMKGMPSALRAFLTDSNILKIGQDVFHSDAKMLRQEYNFELVNAQDLIHLARERGFTRIGLARLAAMTLGVALDKTLARSDWSVRYLSEGQIMYAATDAWVTREIFGVLSDKFYWRNRVASASGLMILDALPHVPHPSFACSVCGLAYTKVVEAAEHAESEGHIRSTSATVECFNGCGYTAPSARILVAHVKFCLSRFRRDESYSFDSADERDRNHNSHKSHQQNNDIVKYDDDYSYSSDEDRDGEFANAFAYYNPTQVAGGLPPIDVRLPPLPPAPSAPVAAAAASVPLQQRKIFVDERRRQPYSRDPEEKLPRPFFCPDCGRSFANEFSAKQHAESRHNIQKFSCKICRKKFDTESGLRRHNSAKHRKARAAAVGAAVATEQNASL